MQTRPENYLFSSFCVEKVSFIFSNFLLYFLTFPGLFEWFSIQFVNFSWIFCFWGLLNTSSSYWWHCSCEWLSSTRNQDRFWLDGPVVVSQPREDFSRFRLFGLNGGHWKYHVIFISYISVHFPNNNLSAKPVLKNHCPKFGLRIMNSNCVGLKGEINPSHARCASICGSVRFNASFVKWSSFWTFDIF